MTNPHFGILNLHKPRFTTSRAVVNLVKRVVRPAKVGHAGTLDPLATGVLLVCVGRATRLVSRIQDMPKTYRARVQFGVESNTGAAVPAVSAVEAALSDFRGEIAQVPPDFSAVHIDGRRAYQLARKGKAVQLQEKTVTVRRLELIRAEGAEFEFEVECGSGTYIRSLARDLGRQLGCGGLLSALERTAIGPFRIADALPAQRHDGNLVELTRQEVFAAIQPAVAAVPDLPTVVCDNAEEQRLRLGRDIAAPQPVDAPEVAVVNDSGRLIAIVTPCGSELRLKPRLVFEAIQ